MIHQNSIDALKSIKEEINGRQLQVMRALKKLDKANNRMIKDFLGVGVNQVTGRTNELRKLGFVSFSFKGIDSISLRNTDYWTLTQKGLNKLEELKKWENQ